MKWIVTLPSGIEVEDTGGSARDAVSNVVRLHLPPPETAKDKPFTVKARRKNPSRMDREETLIVAPSFYWYASPVVDWHASPAAFTLTELLIVLAIIGLLGSLVFGVEGGCSVSDGSRVGTVTKFSHKGLTAATKSWEGELVMGGTRSAMSADGSAALVANVFLFSVLDTAVVPKVQALQDNGHRSKLVYHQTLLHNPVVRSTSYVVLDAIDLDASTNSNVLERKN